MRSMHPTNTTKAPGQDQQAVLNLALLEQYKSRKSNLLERLINAYLEEAPKSFQSLRKAIENGSYDGIRMHAHALKSTSYNLGAGRLSKMCQELEAAAIARDNPKIVEAIKRIGPECFEVEQALCTELFQLKKANAPSLPKSAALDDFDQDWN